VQVVQSFQCTGGLIGSSFQKLFWVKSTGMVLEERFSARGLPPPRLKSCIKIKKVSRTGFVSDFWSFVNLL